MHDQNELTKTAPSDLYLLLQIFIPPISIRKKSFEQNLGLFKFVHVTNIHIIGLFFSNFSLVKTDKVNKKQILFENCFLQLQ